MCGSWQFRQPARPRAPVIASWTTPPSGTSKLPWQAVQSFSPRFRKRIRSPNGLRWHPSQLPSVNGAWVFAATSMLSLGPPWGRWQLRQSVASVI